MTLTITDIIGIISSIAGLSALFAAISNMFSIRVLNKKILADADKIKSEAGKIDQERTTEGMNTVVGGAQAVIGTGTTLLIGLTTRIDRLEHQVQEKEDIIINLNRKIARIIHAIDVSIQRRNQMAERMQCPHECVSIDAQLQGELSRIIANNQIGKEN